MEYESNDFYLSCCLLASGIPLKKLKKENSKFFTFVFDNSQQKVDRIIQDHWNRNLNLPTRTLIDSIHELKTRLHSGV